MLEVREQTRLSFKRMLDICLASIAHRLLRSVVTVAIIMLAIAFLAVMLVEGYLGRATRDAVSVRTGRMAAYSRFLRKTSHVEPAEATVRILADLETGSADYTNYRRWSDLDDAGMADLIARSAHVVKYLDFFDNISIGRRVLLVESNENLEIFDWLPRNYDTFVTRLKDMRSLRLPDGTDALEAFLQEWPAYRQGLERIRRNNVASVQRVAEFCGEAGLPGTLRRAINEEAADDFFAHIGRLGLQIEDDMAPSIIDGLAHFENLNWAYEQLRKNPVRMGWNRRFRERFSPGHALATLANSPRRVDWIEERLQDGGLLGGFDRDRLLSVAREHVEWQWFQDREQRLINRYGETAELNPRTVWLIFVSFLVCVVGIANAMLMSVLERFKEIATMKCLGARNGTIAFLFVTESTIIGIVGGLAGMLVGFIIVFARLTLQFRMLVFERFPVGDMLVSLAVCFLCSLLLAMIAAIYPAWVASRMAPMEAMRVD